MYNFLKIYFGEISQMGFIILMPMTESGKVEMDKHRYTHFVIWFQRKNNGWKIFQRDIP